MAVDDPNDTRTCPLFDKIKVSTAAYIEVYGTYMERGERHQVTLGKIAPDATQDNIRDEFGGAAPFVLAIYRIDAAGKAEGLMTREIEIAGDETWRARVPKLKEADDMRRAGYPPGFQGYPGATPYGPAGPYGAGAYGAVPPQPGAAPFGQHPTYPRPPYGYPPAQPAFIPIPEHGAIAAGLPPDKQQEQINKLMDDKRQDNILDKAVSLAERMGGKHGVNNDAIYSQMQAQLQSYGNMLMQKDGYISQLQQEIFDLRGKNMDLQNQVNLLTQRLNAPAPGTVPAGPATAFAQAAGQMAVAKGMDILGPTLQKLAGSIPGMGGGAPPAPPLPGR